MSDMLRKRGRELEALPGSTDVRESKRFNGELETDLFRHLPLLDKTLAAADEECTSSEDFVLGVMKSLEEEISATCSTFYTPISGDNSSVLDTCSGHESQIVFSDSDIDLSYLLKASDHELGISSNPAVGFKDEICQFSKGFLTSKGLCEEPDLKCHGENWDFQDKFENYQQFSLFEDALVANKVQDYMNRDFISQEMFFDGDFPAV